jgi:hypothetical protein
VLNETRDIPKTPERRVGIKDGAATIIKQCPNGCFVKEKGTDGKRREMNDWLQNEVQELKTWQLIPQEK